MKQKLTFWIYPFAFIAIIGFAISSCKKKDIVPVAQWATLTTSAVTNADTTTALGGGKIFDKGYTTLNAVGLVWDTAHNATLTTNMGKSTASGVPDSTFTVNLTGLKPGTVYYARAYATNKVGTNYGNEVSFKTKDNNPTSGTLTDIDGNVYHWITIGTQKWMVENLQTSHYNDGTPIPNIIDETAWAALTTGATCWYNNDSTTYHTYGKIYNWYALNTNKLAPTGWHVPTTAEWTTLVTFLGGTATAGGPAKEAGTTHWQAPNTGATNSSGFTGLPAGYRYPGSGFSSIGALTIFQSVSENAANPGATNDYFMLQSGNAAFQNPYWIKQAGASVRCVHN